MDAFIPRLMNTFSRLRGWRGKLACFIAGALLALGFAPFHAWPLLFICLPFLFLMLDKARHWRSAALYGWAFGYGHMMAGTYWIANALTVDMEQFGWLMPISILGLSLVMGIWFALFGALYRSLRTARISANILRFAVLWVVVEYLRSLGMFGFPWNLVGSMALAHTPMAQFLAFVGPYGMSFVLVLLGVLPVLWLTGAVNARMRQKIGIMACLVVIALNVVGAMRLPEKAALTETRVRVVQGNIAQSLKWTPQGRNESAQIYGTLSRQQTGEAIPSIILWPETALPFTLREISPWPEQVAQLLPPGGMLITGAVRSTGGEGDYQLYNSIVGIDAAGEWRDAYDKHQLVPFGEFVPLRSLLSLNKITAGSIDFSRGEGVRTVQLDTVPAYRPLVCYEVIFPWLSAGGVRPAWLVNATNDAWYGMSPGPFQHYDAARMRAIEQGLPLVRAANTGISAVIDPYGRAVARLGLNERGIVDQALPKALPLTLYARWGEMVTLILLGLCWIITTTSRFCAKK